MNKVRLNRQQVECGVEEDLDWISNGCGVFITSDITEDPDLTKQYSVRCEVRRVTTDCFPITAHP